MLIIAYALICVNIIFRYNSERKSTIDQIQYKLETQRLIHVLDEIDQQLDISKQATQVAKDQLKEIRRSLWEDLQFGGASTSFEQDVDAVQYLNELNEQGRRFGVNNQVMRRLELLRKNPYFGRFDFYDFELGTTDPIYIGVSSLVDSKTNEYLVYDWRAPISSMFYDYGLGLAEYDAPIGSVRGEIKLKRQFKIIANEIKYMLDSDIKIDDEILQLVLSKSADTKMKNIIYSIQREQNLAIRDELTKILLVQGPAGSGKTSIALHRAAYLLYRYHTLLDAENIVIFSPNGIFSDYIKDVLPELGEDNIQQATIRDYIDRMVRDDWQVEDYYSHLETILTDSNKRQQRSQAIRYKTSPQFYQLLKKYIAYIIKTKCEFQDITINGRLLISKAECDALVQETYRFLPLKARLEKLQRRIRYLLDPIRKSEIRTRVNQLSKQAQYLDANENELSKVAIARVNKDFADIYQHADEIGKLDAYQIYMDLFQAQGYINEQVSPLDLPQEWAAIAAETYSNLQLKQISYEDTAALLYLNGELSGWSTIPNIKHVIIDEAQDYSLFHFGVMKSIFPKASFTILGDINQAIHPYMEPSDYVAIGEIFDQPETTTKQITLTKSYRSTQEIAAFTRALMPVLSELEVMERTGEKPQVIAYSTERGKQLSESINACLDAGHQTVAVICKTQGEVTEAAHLLAGKIKFTEIVSEDTTLTTGVVLLPIYFAKGLEFDAVVIYNASSEVFELEEERILFYTACTRALHKLVIFYADQVTRFISEIEHKFYRKTL